MSELPSMQDISEWLKGISAFPIAVGASDEKHIQLTVFESCSATLAAADTTLTLTSDRELPPEVQGVVDMAQLEAAAKGQARSAAMPTLSEAREVRGKQWASFRIPLCLDGLTRNELANAIWEVSKAQELLAFQINGLKELEALSTELASLEAEAETATEAEASAKETAAPTPEPAPAPPPGGPPPPTPARRFCSSCGREAKPGQRFCIGCGTSLEEQG
jgi:hypothetical protein